MRTHLISTHRLYHVYNGLSIGMYKNFSNISMSCKMEPRRSSMNLSMQVIRLYPSTNQPTTLYKHIHILPIYCIYISTYIYTYNSRNFTTKSKACAGAGKKRRKNCAYTQYTRKLTCSPYHNSTAAGKSQQKKRSGPDFSEPLPVFSRRLAF